MLGNLHNLAKGASAPSVLFLISHIGTEIVCQQRIINLEPFLGSAPPLHPVDQLQMTPFCSAGPEYVGLDSISHKWFLFGLLNYIFCS